MPGYVCIETAHVRGPWRRPDQGGEHLVVPHDRRTRRNAAIGYGAGPQRELCRT
jgi:hypothetical protein